MYLLESSFFTVFTLFPTPKNLSSSLVALTVPLNPAPYCQAWHAASLPAFTLTPISFVPSCIVIVCLH
jgi:hypothetical protein